MTDGRGVAALASRTDMMDRALYERSADAGERWTLLDAAGRPSHRWDAVGNHERYGYETAGRVRELVVEERGGPARTARRWRYGDEPGVLDAALRNVRGRVIEQDDDAGRLVLDRYHLSGEPIEYRRELLADFSAAPDWSAAGGVALAGAHRTRARFDASGRVVRQQPPDGTVREYVYAAAGHVAEVRLTTPDGSLDRALIVSGIETGARGQRSRALLANGVEQTWEYDPRSFRLARLRATGAAGRRYLDVEYTYDPIGNVTRWLDRAQEPTAPTPVLQGATVTSACEFTYDAFYRLLTATGRVHQLLELRDEDATPGRAGVVKGTRHLTLNNGAALERYQRTYDYDLAGNLSRVRHVAASRNWTRDVWTSPSSNRSLPAEDATGAPLVNPESFFDANGNTVRLPHLRSLSWDYAGRLARTVVIDRSAAGDPDDAELYAYDADGTRVRRATQRLAAPGVTEVTETIYFDECEIRRVTRNGALVLERLTSHVGDGAARIATVHRWTRDDLATETDDPAAVRVHYLLGNHLGSTSLELDRNGRVISYEEYFPYGGTSFIAGDQAREVRLKEYRFQQKVRDDVTGFYCFGFRYYVPWIGHWLSPDPAGPIDGPNLFAFVHGNPIRFTDEEGLQTAQGTVEVNRIEELPAGIVEKLRSDPALLERFNRDDAFFVPDGAGGYRDLTRAQMEEYAKAQVKKGKTVRLNLQGRPAETDDGDGGVAAAKSALAKVEEFTEQLDMDEILRPLKEAKIPGSDGKEKGGEQASGGDGGKKGKAHPADGSLEDGEIEPGKSAESGSNGNATTGTGPGAGNQGEGKGAKTTEGEQTETPGTGGTGGGKGSSGKGTGSGGKSGKTGGTGDPAGVAGGVEGGLPGGRIGGTGTAPLPPGVTADPNAKPPLDPATTVGNETREGSKTGTPDGVSKSGDQQGGKDARGKPGSDGGGGTRPDGVKGGKPEGKTMEGREGGTSEQAGSEEGKGSGEPESALDKATRWAGYLNLSFSGSQDGDRGGVPGGLGLLGLKGKFFQVLYIITSVISTVTMVWSIVK
ncbi:MAG TPA: RHS repeat-associated core domain-containing protein, partial [Gemmatimonadales bacterium]|nr:RHS repeat-associated core domain-containing protein [Gemmatimonadales bacterium]